MDFTKEQTSVIIAFGALVAAVGGPSIGVEVSGIVMRGADGVMELVGHGGEPGSMVLAAGLVPGIQGTTTVAGGQSGPGGDGGEMRLLATTPEGSVTVLRLLGGRRAPTEA